MVSCTNPVAVSHAGRFSVRQGCRVPTLCRLHRTGAPLLPFIRAELDGDTEYRLVDSDDKRLGITHLPSNTRLRVLSSNGKTAMGIVNCPILVADEPGSWEVVGGTLMYDAIVTALGKPGVRCERFLSAPLHRQSDGWWHHLISDGTGPTTYVQSLQGDKSKWDTWGEIKRCNPLTAISKEFRKRLLVERDAARLDSRLLARFKSYRLNLPSGDESEVLLTTADWEQIESRPVPERVGKPIVGVDLGGGRAWSSAVALWPNGRVEARAIAPGIPDLEEQERRDRAPSGQYGELFDRGQFDVAEGLRVQPPALLWALVLASWGKPRVVVCDRFRLNAELQDATGNGVRLEPRVSRWSEAAFDIRSLRKFAKDGPLSVDDDSRALLATSLSKAPVKNDDQGVAPRSAKRRDNFCGNERRGHKSHSSGISPGRDHLFHAYPDTIRITLSHRMLSPSQNNSCASFSSIWYGAFVSASNNGVSSAQTSRSFK